MSNNQTFFFIFILFLSVIQNINAESDKQRHDDVTYEVIPLPQEIQYSNKNDFFILTRSTVITFPKGDNIQFKNASFLQKYIYEKTNLSLDIKTEEINIERNSIKLQSNIKNNNNEAYHLNVNKNYILINGTSHAGTFYGIQTLFKSINIKNQDQEEIYFPCVTINDFPRFEYRGMMLDVSRHFFPVSFIKEFIDILAIHNINRFHWHLTDDQGWRIQIEAYPLLTTIGASRKNAVINPKTAFSEEDGTIYGPYYYSKDEVREVVKYAKERYIEIIPEINVPGHTTALLASYPELGCTGGPYEVANSRGIYHDVLCLGKPDTYILLEGIFNEITDLFPYEYIHIGGDECPTTRWNNCQKCIHKAESLGINVNKLQNHCVEYLQEIVNKKGKKIIGWDEILYNNMNQSTTIMAWRGTGSTLKAISEGYDVIMTPNNYFYFDYAQSECLDNEPISMGNFISVEQVYSFESFLNELSNNQKKVKGIQANLWTEFIQKSDVVEYMLLPRLAALSEVQWTLGEKKDYNMFLSRLPQMLAYYDQKKYNYAKHVYDVQFDVSRRNNNLFVSLSAMGNPEITYKLNENNLTKYVGNPIKIDRTSTLTVFAHKDRFPQERKFNFNKATNKVIASKNYSKNVNITKLVDGILGNSNYRDGNWGMFGNDDLDITVDLGKTEQLSSVAFRSFVRQDNRVFAPTKIQVFVSEDNQNFSRVCEKDLSINNKKEKIGIRETCVDFEKTDGRFVRLIISKLAKVPDWHRSAGARTIMCIDEIILN